MLSVWKQCCCNVLFFVSLDSFLCFLCSPTFSVFFSLYFVFFDVTTTGREDGAVEEILTGSDELRARGTCRASPALKHILLIYKTNIMLCWRSLETSQGHFPIRFWNQRSLWREFLWNTPSPRSFYSVMSLFSCFYLCDGLISLKGVDNYLTRGETGAKTTP